MKKAFNIIEILIVVFVIGILLAIVIPAFSSLRKDALLTQQITPEQTPIISMGEPSLFGYSQAYIIRDTENKQEYIVVSSSTGISVTPRLPKKNEE